MKAADVSIRTRPRTPSLFGSRMRERTLELLALVDEIHLREAARVLDAPPSETLKAVAALEKSGVVVSRLIGRTRFVSLNRRWFAAVELRRLLERMTEANPKLRQRVDDMRPRPRRIGKPL